MESMLIAVDTYRYRLRIAVCLLAEHNKTVLTTQATEYSHVLLVDMLEAAEDAASSLQKLKDQPAAPEAGLGSEQL